MVASNEVHQAMILAAGEGTRLRPLTLKIPKVLLPIGGRPLLEYILSWLRLQGITEVAINLHHKPEAVIAYFGAGESFGVKITYSVEDPVLGTAGALSKLRHYFTETFLVIYGDILTDLNISPLIKFHREKQAQMTIALHRVTDPCNSGVVELDNESRIHRFVEKPFPEEVFTNLANAGIYILEPEVLNLIPSNTFYDFGFDLLPSLIDSGMQIYGYPITEYLIDIGTMTSYYQAEVDLQQRTVE
ncbi:MAG: nucleotidyltransferase family protein [Chloroflexi bacterium]|nr:nucleotidyltransferase family protein [Chloroflexota bacterium]